jgi:DNA ligase D-like protein (predicted 3'-phosphoesterase)
MLWDPGLKFLPMFVVHEHWASRHHFDLRLEMDGVLKSWAVPKGLPLEPRTRRLAIQVEDHALEYGSFEGTIPEGEYGAGRVSIWDKGKYVLLESSPRRIHVEFRGKKLSGEYELVYMRDERGSAQWLVFKRSRSN